MFWLSEWQCSSELSRGLDLELAASPHEAERLLRGRLPLLFLFVDETHKRLLSRIAREELDSQAIVRIAELSRQTAAVAALSMWRASWAELLPAPAAAHQLRAIAPPPAALVTGMVPRDGLGWDAVVTEYRSLMRLLPYPEELEDRALALLPDGDGVGLDDEQVYSAEDLAAGFFLSLSGTPLSHYPRLECYVDSQLERLGCLVARNYLTPRLSRGVMRCARAVTLIAAASVWHSAWRGLERAGPLPSPFWPTQLRLFAAASTWS